MSYCTKPNICIGLCTTSPHSYLACGLAATIPAMSSIGTFFNFYWSEYNDAKAKNRKDFKFCFSWLKPNCNGYLLKNYYFLQLVSTEQNAKFHNSRSIISCIQFQVIEKV